MSIADSLKIELVGSIVKENAPTILAGVGVLATVATGIFAFKGGMRAQQIIDKEEAERDEPLERKELVKFVWREGVPAMAVAGLGIFAIVYGNQISLQRAAVLAGAYKLLENNFEDYKKEAKKRLGIPETSEKETTKTDSIPDVENKEDQPAALLEPYVGKNTDGHALYRYLEPTTGAEFVMTAMDLEKAILKLNQKLLNDDVSLNDFSREVGVNDSTVGDEYGWSGVEIGYFTNATVKSRVTGQPCLRLDFSPWPKRGMARVD